MTKETIIKNILQYWREKGDTSFQGMPVCPELVYRLDGKWNGWNDFLGVKLESDEFSKNIKRDEIENEAFEIWKRGDE